MEKLEKMFEMQKKFSGHWADFDKLTDTQKQETGRQYVLDLFGEVSEIRQSFDIKAWRKKPENKVAEECADAFAYVMSICLTFNIDSKQFFDAYKNKMQQNESDYQRRNNGRQ